MVTPAAKREAVAHMRTRFAVSERRACSVLEVDRMMVRYRSTRPDDAALRERLKALAQERRRFGYRRLHVLLRREGHVVNHKRLFRLYREERLMVRRRGGRKRALGTRAPMMQPDGPNVRWSLDFVHDQLATGRKLRVLTIVDTFSRYAPAIEPRFSFRGADVVDVLERVGGRGRLPGGDPCRPGQRVHLPRPRSVGLPPRSRAGLLPPGKPVRTPMSKAERQVRASDLNEPWFLSLEARASKDARLA
jgi:putative transposase